MSEERLTLSISFVANLVIYFEKYKNLNWKDRDVVIHNGSSNCGGDYRAVMDENVESVVDHNYFIRFPFFYM